MLDNKTIKKILIQQNLASEDSFKQLEKEAKTAKKI